jgi:hypothetical protein
VARSAHGWSALGRFAQTACAERGPSARAKQQFLSIQTERKDVFSKALTLPRRNCAPLWLNWRGGWASDQLGPEKKWKKKRIGTHDSSRRQDPPPVRCGSAGAEHPKCGLLGGLCLKKKRIESISAPCNGQRFWGGACLCNLDSIGIHNPGTALGI